MHYFLEVAYLRHPYLCDFQYFTHTAGKISVVKGPMSDFA